MLVGHLVPSTRLREDGTWSAVYEGFDFVATGVTEDEAMQRLVDEYQRQFFASKTRREDFWKLLEAGGTKDIRPVYLPPDVAKRFRGGLLFHALEMCADDNSSDELSNPPPAEDHDCP